MRFVPSVGGGMRTRPMNDAVDPDLIETFVDVSRPIDGGVDVLRQFSASISYSNEPRLRLYETLERPSDLVTWVDNSRTTLAA